MQTTTITEINSNVTNFTNPNLEISDIINTQLVNQQDISSWNNNQKSINENNNLHKDISNETSTQNNTNNNGIPIKTIADISHYKISKDTLIRFVTQYIEKDDNKEITSLYSLGGTNEIIKLLNSNLQVGLDNSTLDEQNRKAQFGENHLPRRKLSTIWQLCYNSLKDLILIILMACGLISLVFGIFFGEHPEIDWIEGFAIWIAVIIVVAITATNDMIKERQFEKLAKLMDAKKCTVLRNGQKNDISVFDVVVGDILSLEIGDEIPADCICTYSNDFKTDESSLTGETDEMKKDTIEKSIIRLTEARKNRESSIQSKAVSFQESLSVSTPIILSGSVVINGSGYATVIAVGTNTIAGSAFQKLALAIESTPLQNKLNALTHHIGHFGVGSSALALLMLVIQYWIVYFTTEESLRPNSPEIFQEHLEFVIIAITVIVVAVPEGLPLAVTLSLAYSIRRMLKDQNFVRRLNACEIMGGADQICSDKTGTLTQNKMSIDSFWNGTSLYYYENLDTVSPPEMGSYFQPFIEGMAVNNTAYIQIEEILLPGAKNKKATVRNGMGSSTECAMLFYLERFGYDYNTIRNEVNSHSFVADQKIFTSFRKMMSTTYCLNQSTKHRTYVKGAAEKVLSFCEYRIDSKGELKRLADSDKAKIEKHVINNMASQALRCVCLAYKDFDSEQSPDWNELSPDGHCYNMEKNLICLGILGIRDPLRLGVPAAIKQCKTAGVKVRMITGDNIETAKQIALMCGIYNPEKGGTAMLGSDFYTTIGGIVCKNCKTEFCDCPIDDKTASQKGKSIRVDTIGNLQAFETIAPTLEVMARSQPRDKYALVTGLKELGSVVAVTGDGNNDAPALKKADVGFAMGIAGKDVAKMAADIIILDDNFESIVKAIKWGRGVFENIRRFFTFQLTVNVVAVFFTLATVLTLRQSPLTALQLLWVNLIMDSFASLALATEPPSDELLEHPPYKRTEYLITKNMFSMILSQAAYQFIVLLILVFAGDLFIPESEWSFVTDEMRQEYNFSEFSSPDSNIIKSGRRFKVFSNQTDYLDDWFDNISPSRHMTIVFNTFVFMQIFNLLNARNPKRKWNIFSGILVNKLWIIIFFLIVIMQSIIATFGGIIFSVHLNGLTGIQWLICLAFGLGGIFVHWLMKYFPIKLLPQAGQKEIDIENEPVSIALASRGRLSRGNFSSRLSAGLFTLSDTRKEIAQRSAANLSHRKSLLRSSVKISQ